MPHLPPCFRFDFAVMPLSAKVGAILFERHLAS
jgi:hypothetical protein